MLTRHRRAIAALFTAVAVGPSGLVACAGIPAPTVTVATTTVATGTVATGTVATAVAPVATATLVSAGGDFTCALVSGGAVTCWGANGHGELGDGTTRDRSIPGAVVGLDQGVQAVAAGRNHACALASSGAVSCWGSNMYGQLGDGTTLDRVSPVEVRGLSSGVQSIASGYGYTCVVTTSETVKCWGDNRFGQLGDGSTTSRLKPVKVVGLTSVRAVAAGYDHACALTADSAVRCWGWNGNGWLGDGTTKEHLTPVKVTDTWAKVRAIASSSTFTCALTTGAAVKCWGFNLHGELGIGETSDRETPEDVLGLSSRIANVTAGENHACATTLAGDVKCWGRNHDGQVGDKTTTDRLKPVAVKDLSAPILAASAGQTHTCAVATTGTVLCWGNNDHGQLGDGTTRRRVAPVSVTGLG